MDNKKLFNTLKKIVLVYRYDNILIGGSYINSRDLHNSLQEANHVYYTNYERVSDEDLTDILEVLSMCNDERFEYRSFIYTTIKELLKIDTILFTEYIYKLKNSTYNTFNVNDALTYSTRASLNENDIDVYVYRAIFNSVINKEQKVNNYLEELEIFINGKK